MTLDDFFETFDQFADAPSAVAKMRELILQLAVQGKLAQQDPADEPASVLLQQIRAEKRGLIEKGKIKKSAPLRPVEEREKPFGIATRWVWTRLGDAFMSISDGDHQSPPKVADGVPFLVIGNVSSGSLDFSATRYVSNTYFQSLDSIRVPAQGDILYTVTGSFGMAIEVNVDRDFCVQRHMAIMKPFKMMDAAFWAYWLRSEQVHGQSKARATGIAQKTVSLSTLRNISVPLPPIAEQKRIVAKVDELMGLCDQLEAQQQERDRLFPMLSRASHERLTASPIPANLQTIFAETDEVSPADLRKTVLTLAVQGKLVPQDPNDEPVGIASDLGVQPALPSDWHCASLVNCLSFGPRNGLSPKPVSHETPIRSLTLSATSRGRFDETCSKFVDIEVDADSHLWLKPDDILIQRGNSLDYVGIAAIYEGKPSQFIYPDLMMKLQTCTDLSPEFAVCVLNSPMGRPGYSANCRT